MIIRSIGHLFEYRHRSSGHCKDESMCEARMLDRSIFTCATKVIGGDWQESSYTIREYQWANTIQVIIGSISGRD